MLTYLPVAVTRTLTVVYSISLLSAFTQVQLSLLGRYKYMHSMVQLERDEETREQNDLSIASLFFAPQQNTFDSEALLGKADIWQEDSLWQEGVDSETERKYLTLSWWILNVGWKDVGERVRRGVEDAFEECVVSHSSRFVSDFGLIQRLVEDEAGSLGIQSTDQRCAKTRRTRDHF
jgi:hypothetical protein